MNASRALKRCLESSAPNRKIHGVTKFTSLESDSTNPVWHACFEFVGDFNTSTNINFFVSDADLFGTDEIMMIAQMRNMGNTMVPRPLRGALVAALVAAIPLTVLNASGDNPELAAVVDVIRPALGISLGAIFAVAAYGASQIGRKGPAASS